MTKDLATFKTGVPKVFPIDEWPHQTGYQRSHPCPILRERRSEYEVGGVYR